MRKNGYKIRNFEHTHADGFRRRRNKGKIRRLIVVCGNKRNAYKIHRLTKLLIKNTANAAVSEIGKQGVCRFII